MKTLVNYIYIYFHKAGEKRKELSFPSSLYCKWMREIGETYLGYTDLPLNR